jgi:hypothetical protein
MATAPGCSRCDSRRRKLSIRQPKAGVTVTSYFSRSRRPVAEDADWASQALQTTKPSSARIRTLAGGRNGTTAGGIEHPGMVVIASRLYDDSNRTSFEAPRCTSNLTMVVQRWE